jgi:hypothetical protein
MDLQRIGIKIFAEDSAAVDVRDFIPVFHTWIQKQAVDNHMLIDVHNYSHIRNGPGILLVAQEGNFSIDLGDGRMGLLYYRKNGGSSFPPVLKAALQACSLLESDPTFAGKLRFRTDEMQIVANDRLLAPNSEETLSALKPDLISALKSALPESQISLSRSSVNPKERFAVRVETSPSADVETLLARL